MTQIIAIRRFKGLNVDAIAAAMQIQMQRDVAPVWGTDIQVIPYSPPKKSTWWRVQFYNHLPPGMGGVHLNTRSGQPYAKILLDEGSVACSHEIVEMAVDPLGERFHTIGSREYLVEACDPCETDTYLINGVEVSDFILPSWYGGGAPHDHLGRIAKPEGLRPGGYVSWIENGGWFQAFADASGHVSTQYLGPAASRTRAEKDAAAARA